MVRIPSAAEKSKYKIKCLIIIIPSLSLQVQKKGTKAKKYTIIKWNKLESGQQLSNNKSTNLQIFLKKSTNQQINKSANHIC